MRIKRTTRLLVAAVSLAALFSTDSYAVVVLESVNWTQQETAPTSLLGGSWSFGTLTGTTGAIQYRAGNAVVIAPTTGDSVNDGFLININESFGPGNNLVFDFVNSGVSSYQTVAFNLGQGAAAGPVAGHGSVHAGGMVGYCAVGVMVPRTPS